MGIDSGLLELIHVINIRANHDQNLSDIISIKTQASRSIMAIPKQVDGYTQLKKKEKKRKLKLWGREKCLS